jgi:hypothetical protein
LVLDRSSFGAVTSTIPRTSASAAWASSDRRGEAGELDEVAGLQEADELGRA